MTGFKQIKDFTAVLTAENGQETQYVPVIMIILNGKNYYIFKAVDDPGENEDTLLLSSEQDEEGNLRFYVVDTDDTAFDMILNQIEWEGGILN